MSSISCERLGHKVDLLHQARCGPVDRTADGRALELAAIQALRHFADGREHGR